MVQSLGAVGEGPKTVNVTVSPFSTPAVPVRVGDDLVGGQRSVRQSARSGHSGVHSGVADPTIVSLTCGRYWRAHRSSRWHQAAAAGRRYHQNRRVRSEDNRLAGLYCGTDPSPGTLPKVVPPLQLVGGVDCGPMMEKSTVPDGAALRPVE